MRRTRDTQLAALDGDIARLARRIAGHFDPGLVECISRGLIRRHQPHLDACELFQPEVGAGVEPQHVHASGDLRDEWQEQRAVQTALVQILGRDVGGCDHDGAEFEQFREQPAENHRIGNVGDVKLVEAQQPRLVEDRLGGEPDHVGVADLAARDILPVAVDPLVHLGHEFVEMGAALVRHLALLEEQVHQHGLAAPDLAMDVEPAWRRLVLVGEQPAEQALLAPRLVAGQPRLEVRECIGGHGLRRISLDRA